MPQMKPLNWILLFIFMNMLLMLMNIMNYFILNYNMKLKINNKKKIIYNWKW